MNPAERDDQSTDDSALSFGQLLGLIATCCTGCLILARFLGMGWISSIAFAYVGGAALVVVGCLVALRILESGLFAKRGEPEPEAEWSSEWPAGRHIDSARCAVMARNAAAGASGTAVGRRIGALSDVSIEPRVHRSDIY
ncbi:hypothetical protein [Citreimonas sp.]|uniref:hypothetical protein n=1 Tax=Citreimonas sp. TaxID=3036715 RepID=UPI004058AB43